MNARAAISKWNFSFLSSLKNYVHSGVYLFYKIFIKPRSLDEDSKRREFILNIILTSSLFLIALMNVLVLHNLLRLRGNYTGIPITASLITLLIFSILTLLSRFGLYIISSYLLLTIYFVTITYAIYNWGPDLPTALLSYALVIIVSSILISTRFAFFVTSFISCVIIIFTYLQSRFLLSPRLDWKTETLGVYDGIGFAALLLIITVVSWLSNREIERSLSRARKSEAALKEQRDLLEITVEERTKQLQATQAEKIDQLYRFAEFGRLASGLFHDLMNPLTSVSLYLEQISKTSPGQAEQTQRYLEKAFEASKRIERFTQAVRKQLQHREAQELFSVNEGIRQAVQLVAHKAWQARVQISFHSSAEVTTFDNPLKFHQIILNLLSNAIDAYDDIPLSADRKREVAITVNKTQQEIVIVIQDWGAGIPENARDKIFQPFYTTKPAHQGMGIGLSTTKEIIERDFHGTIQVDTTEGYGTTFRITFRCHPATS